MHCVHESGFFVEAVHEESGGATISGGELSDGSGETSDMVGILSVHVLWGAGADGG